MLTIADSGRQKKKKTSTTQSTARLTLHSSALQLESQRTPTQSLECNPEMSKPYSTNEEKQPCFEQTRAHTQIYRQQHLVSVSLLLVWTLTSMHSISH